MAQRQNRSEGLSRTRLFHPWGCEPEGGVVRLRRSVSHVVGHGHLLISGWVPLGPIRARRGSSGTRMGPYLSCTPIRVHQVFRQGSLGPVRPYRLKSGFRRLSVGTPIWHNRPRRGLTDHSTVPYPCTTEIRTLQGPYGGPRGRRGPRRDPTGPRRPAGGTVGPCFIGAPRFGAPMRPSLLSA